MQLKPETLCDIATLIGYVAEAEKDVDENSLERGEADRSSAPYFHSIEIGQHGKVIGSLVDVSDDSEGWRFEPVNEIPPLPTWPPLRSA